MKNIEPLQKPMFDIHGTLKENRKIIIYELGYCVPNTRFVNEKLEWYDGWLGR